MEEDESQHRGDSPNLFQEECEFFKVPHIALVKVERLHVHVGQQLNVPTQGWRAAQTGTKRFSLKVPGSDLQLGIEPKLHWWETDVLTTQLPWMLYSTFLQAHHGHDKATSALLDHGADMTLVDDYGKFHFFQWYGAPLCDITSVPWLLKCTAILNTTSLQYNSLVLCLYTKLSRQRFSILLMLCTPVFIFTSGGSALLKHPHCGLVIWLLLLAIFNRLFWVYANLFHTHKKPQTKHENSRSLSFSYDMEIAAEGD